MLFNVYDAQCTVQCTANAISNKKKNNKLFDFMVGLYFLKKSYVLIIHCDEIHSVLFQG